MRVFFREVALAAVFDGVAREDEARALALTTLREHVAKKAAKKFSAADSPLYAYIPNLTELMGDGD